MVQPIKRARRGTLGNQELDFKYRFSVVTHNDGFYIDLLSRNTLPFPLYVTYRDLLEEVATELQRIA
jgi:hypothetical protein